MRLHYITFHFVCHLNETNFGMDEYALLVVYVYVNVFIVRARFRLYVYSQQHFTIRLCMIHN